MHATFQYNTEKFPVCSDHGRGVLRLLSFGQSFYCSLYSHFRRPRIGKRPSFRKLLTCMYHYSSENGGYGRKTKELSFPRRGAATFDTLPDGRGSGQLSEDLNLRYPR